MVSLGNSSLKYDIPSENYYETEKDYESPAIMLANNQSWIEGSVWVKIKGKYTLTLSGSGIP